MNSQLQTLKPEDFSKTSSSSNAPVEIRRLCQNDSVIELTELLHRAFAKGTDQPFAYPAAIQDAHSTLEQIQDSTCWVATVGSEIAGLAILNKPHSMSKKSSNDRRFGAHLRQLAVNPLFQGKGLGSQLLQACERDAIDMNAQHLWGSSPVGSRQLSLYRRHGYQLMQCLKWPNTNYTSVIFSKRFTGKLNFRDIAASRLVYYKSLAWHRFGFLERGGLVPSIKQFLALILSLLTKVCLSLRWSRQKHILLCCNNPLMADYLTPFWELLKNDPRLLFKLVFVGRAETMEEAYVNSIRAKLPIPCVSSRWARIRTWDLIVLADHAFNNAMLRSPRVYIGHGPKCKVLPGNDTEYAYGEDIYDRHGRIIYSKIFAENESDRENALQTNPELKDVVTVVGNLENDQVLDRVHDRGSIRRSLGYSPNDVAVFIISTWGEYCLWHIMGDGLLEEARNLLGEFKFILSAHPHEFRADTKSNRIWGEYLRTQRQYGFLVREPSDSWIPYMIAADIVISDYTGLIEYAVLLNKPIILTPVPDNNIWKDSIIGKIRQFAPLLNNPKRLREYLMNALSNYPLPKLLELNKDIYCHPGEAAVRIRQEIYSLLKIPATIANKHNPLI